MSFLGTLFTSDGALIKDHLEVAYTFLYLFQFLLAITLGVTGFLFLLSNYSQSSEVVQPTDAEHTDPGLLKKHSEFRSYHVPATGFTYPSIRTFYRKHPQADKLPSKPMPLPLLVFVHGLGGGVSQFGGLLTSLVNVAPCLSIDFPGCGRSAFKPTEWRAYSLQSLAKLVEVVVDEYRDKEQSQRVIFIGHSMGCSISALLASNINNTVKDSPKYATGLIAICPRADPATREQAVNLKRFLNLPGFVIDLLRRYDRRGGIKSSSVKRMVGVDAEPQTQKLQLRFNKQSQTPVFRRMAWGVLPEWQGELQVDGFPGKEMWSALDLPVFLIAGESDIVTKPEEAERISSYIQAAWTEKSQSGDLPMVNGTKNSKEMVLQSPSPLSPGKAQRALKLTILPAPAAHALLFAPATCRTISGLIHSFFSDHIDERLSLGWQLQHLATEGKWDVKNLVKWKGVIPVSEPIADTFRAMKTMREVDGSHSPTEFAKQWSGEIQAVIDISHETPVYDPNNLEKGGITYHKFPTVSKMPPTREETTHFNDLVDGLKTAGNKHIAVHCHYGYNRTGYFIVCYLVDRMGWRLQDAVEEFAKRRPPGIRHDYFVDTLFATYQVGIKQAPTL